MIRLRPILLPLVLAAFLPILPGRAVAVPVAFEREVRLDWPLPDARILRLVLHPDPRPLARVRLFMAEITLLPSGRLVARTIVVLPHRPLREPPPRPDPLILPLPSALPLFMGALAGLFLIGRRRRPPPGLAGAHGAP